MWHTCTKTGGKSKCFSSGLSKISRSKNCGDIPKMQSGDTPVGSYLCAFDPCIHQAPDAKSALNLRNNAGAERFAVRQNAAWRIAQRPTFFSIQAKSKYQRSLIILMLIVLMI
jgi:hypothetical protein